MDYMLNSLMIIDPEQPIFYPVINIEYARQIALEWNTKSAPGYAGFDVV